MNKRRLFFSFLCFVGLVVGGAFLYRASRIQAKREAREEVLRALERESARIDVWIQSVRHSVDAWELDGQAEPLDRLGLETVRIFEGSRILREWKRPGAQDLAFELEEPLLQSTEPRFLQMDSRYFAMAWPLKSRKQAFVLIPRETMPSLTDEGGISFALINSSEQLLAFSGQQLVFDVFRPDLRYALTPPEAPELVIGIGEIIAWRRLPDFSHVFLVARILD